MQQMVEDHVAKLTKQKFVIILVIVFSGLQTRGVSVNYQAKINRKAVVKGKCLDQCGKLMNLLYNNNYNKV